MNHAETPLSGRQVLATIIVAILFGVPAVIMVELEIGPGRWIIEVQDRLLGYHLMVTSVVLVMFLELMCVLIPLFLLGVTVRVITGRTLVELFQKSRR